METFPSHLKFLFKNSVILVFTFIYVLQYFFFFRVLCGLLHLHSPRAAMQIFFGNQFFFTFTHFYNIQCQYNSSKASKFMTKHQKFREISLYFFSTIIVECGENVIPDNSNTKWKWSFSQNLGQHYLTVCIVISTYRFLKNYIKHHEYISIFGLFSRRYFGNFGSYSFRPDFPSHVYPSANEIQIYLEESRQSLI